MTRFWQVFGLYYQRYLRRKQHLVLLMLAIMLLVVEAINRQTLRPAREIVQTALVPISYPFAVLHDSINSSVDYTINLFHAAELHEQLREENALLRQWYEYAQALEVENKQLRDFLQHNAASPNQTIVHFQLRGGDKSLTEPILHIHTEEDQTLPLYAAVISNNGLIGRITPHTETSPSPPNSKDLRQTQYGTVEIMLVSHPESRIPVQVGEEGIQAILTGQGGDIARLDYYHHQATSRLKAGDQVVSSGFLGYLPTGLNIGTIQEVTPKGIAVKLAFDPTKLRYIGVITAHQDNYTQQLLQSLQQNNKP